jgi:GDPmannose 4,6-dehydratase
MSARRALITGVTGQDGSFLAELLLEKGYVVVGAVHGRPTDPLGCSDHLRGQLSLVSVDLERPESLRAAVAQTQPEELYHLAAPSFMPASWQRPAQTVTMIAGATATLLEAVRDHSPHTRVFVASSGAIFGSAPESPQREDTPCRPETPYAAAKLLAHHLTGMMRAHSGIFACSGILYNHESERRPTSFVPRKITRAAAEIKLGLAEAVKLGDVHAIRDWGFAGDMMQGAWLSLQQEHPADYVFATGIGHTVAELAEIAFGRLGLDAWQHIEVDPTLQRAAEPTPRVGDASRAREILGWRPTLTFEQTIARMVDADMRAAQAAKDGVDR